MANKFLVTTTGKAPSVLAFTNLPNTLAIVHPTANRDFMRPDPVTGDVNTYNDLITDSQIKEALRNNWITVIDEHGLELDSIVGRHIDVNTTGITDGDALSYSGVGDNFDWTPGGGGGGSDYFQETAFALNAGNSYTQVIPHTATRKVKAEFRSGTNEILEIDYVSTNSDITITGLSGIDVSGSVLLN